MQPLGSVRMNSVLLSQQLEFFLLISPEPTQASVTLLLETEEVKHSISQLSQKVKYSLLGPNHNNCLEQT